MSAEFCQKIPTACQFFIHGIAFDRSSRSFDSIFGIRQYKYRTIVIFSHTSSHKAGKAFMTIRQIDNKHLIPPDICLFHFRHCLIYNAVCHISTTLIQCFQITCQHICLPPCLCPKQCQCSFCRIQLTTGIQTRSKNKSDVICLNLFSLQSDTLDQGT